MAKLIVTQAGWKVKNSKGSKFLPFFGQHFHTETTRTSNFTPTSIAVIVLKERTVLFSNLHHKLLLSSVFETRASIFENGSFFCLKLLQFRLAT